jgi:hypothetical protein
MPYLLQPINSFLQIPHIKIQFSNILIGIPDQYDIFLVDSINVILILIYTINGKNLAKLSESN